MSALTPLFAPRSVAVVGASRTPGKLGAALARSLDGFAAAGGRLALVNGRDGTMYPSLAAAAADGPVDLAMICVPAPACPGVLAEAVAVGVGAAVICAGGFAEAGGPGVGYQDELAAVVRDSGIRLLGPNTSGFLVPPRALTASFVPGAASVQAGRVAVVAASGGVNHALAFLLAEAGHGISLAVGLGNGVDVTAPDVLAHLATDASTGAVALHVESVADGPALVEAVATLVPHKAVVALVVGRNDVAEFAASHTGALATSWRITRAALAQAGAVLVDDERELVDAVGALSVTRAAPAVDPGVGVVTAQAGPGLLLLDELRGRCARVPALTEATQATLATLLPPLTFQRNPVNTGRPGPEFGAVLSAVSEDPRVDVIAGFALYEPDAVDLAAVVEEGRRTNVPVVLGVGGTGTDVLRCRADLISVGVAVATSPHGVAVASGAVLADARHRARIGGTPDPVEVSVAGPLDESQAKDLLDTLGIATMPRRACADRAEARAALAELGGPVAVKLLDATVLHKTEIGGVALGIRDSAELESALDALETAGACRFLVERMAPGGVDLVVGARRDAVFGPIVLVGLGGTTAEAVADVSVRLAPLTAGEAALMPAELAGRALLEGWRNGPSLDPAALGEVVARLGGVLAAAPDLAEIEVNPLRLTDDGLVALDAVVLHRKAADARPRQ